MKRRLVNFVVNGLAVLSVLLCVATCVLCVRSYFVQDVYLYFRSSAGPGWQVRRTTEVRCNRGELVVSKLDNWMLAADDRGLGIVARMASERDPNAGHHWQTSDTRFYRWNPAGPRDPLWRRLGFQAEGVRYVQAVPYVGLVQRSLSWKVGLPCWALATIFAMPCAIRILRRGVRRRLDRAGRCPSCGYDLRATPDRCPECGTAAA